MINVVETAYCISEASKFFGELLQREYKTARPSVVALNKHEDEDTHTSKLERQFRLLRLAPVDRRRLQERFPLIWTCSELKRKKMRTPWR